MSMFIKTGIKHQYLLILIKKFQGNANPPAPGNVHKTFLSKSYLIQCCGFVKQLNSSDDQ